ncbi:hypothetical protein HN51_035418 [Arachis hypogaea]
MAPHLGKLGTLTSDIAGQLKELRQGRIEFKIESKSILHIGLGKVSYKEEALRENIGAFMNAVLLAKPAGLKKSNFQICWVCAFCPSKQHDGARSTCFNTIAIQSSHNYRKVHVV